MASTFEGVLEFSGAAAERLALSEPLASALASPAREVSVQLRIPMDEGSYRVLRGYRVQFNDARGPFKGGIRFHDRVTIDEIRTFAALMTWKTALMNIPFGGGKGGVQVDPGPLSEGELERLARAYMQAIASVIGSQVDVPAPDVNTDATIMGWMADEFARTVGPDPAVITGKPLTLGGSLGRDAATGRGSAICLDRIVKEQGRAREETAVAVQGYGNAGSWLAIILQELGYPVVAVSDTTGAVHAPGGLPAAEVLAHKGRTGSVAGFEDTETLPSEEILGIECAVLALAGLEESVNAETEPAVKAEVVVETANHPVTPEAERALTDRGVIVVPDILASGGGVVVSYFEWAQNLQLESWEEQQVNDSLEHLMATATDQVLTLGKNDGITQREAAYLIGVGRVAEAESARGFR